MTIVTCRVYLVGGEDIEHCFGVFEQDVARRIAADTEAFRLPPAVRIAGFSSSWLVLAHGQLYRDALFAVTTGPEGEESLANCRLVPKMLAVVDDRLDQILELLSAVTSAALALVAIADSAARRPLSTESDIRRCRSWLQHAFLQYLTGRGAQRQIVGPWSRFVDDHEYLLQRLERDWMIEIRGRLSALALDHPLRPILEPFGIASSERESVDILSEYRSRLSVLSTECGRVSAEIGVVGTLLSLALVPVANVLEWWFLAPVGVAALLYYGGHSVSNVWPRIKLYKRRHKRRSQAAYNGSPTIAELASSLAGRQLRVLAGPRMAMADFAASVSLWLCMLQRSEANRPMHEVELVSVDEPDERFRIIVGGPLVRVRLAGDAASLRPVCELTDVGGEGWHFRVNEQEVADASDEERLGCVSTATASSNALFVFGTRDVGTVAAARWVNALVKESNSNHEQNHRASGSWCLIEGDAPPSSRTGREVRACG